MAFGKFIGMALAAMALSACAASPAVPAAARETTMAQAFAKQAAYCAARNDTTHPVFRGCVDWHSSAHAHYALTAYQTLTGDDAYDLLLDGSLTPTGLAAELRDLRADPAFEAPYGRAWFLRLYLARKAAGGDDRLAPLATEIARSMEAMYRAAPADPNARDYRSATFAMINLLAYARAEKDARLEAFVVAETRSRWMAPEARCNLAAEPRGFLSTCLSWAWLVSDVATKAEFATWYARWNPGLETLAPLDLAPGANAHLFGKNFSRAWGFAALYGATADARYRDLYCAHLGAGYAQWDATKDDYMAVGHWAAQFGVLALEQGRVGGMVCG